MERASPDDCMPDHLVLNPCDGPEQAVRRAELKYSVDGLEQTE